MSPLLTRVSNSQGITGLSGFRRAFIGRRGVDGYAITRSLRFNSSDSAYLSRTPGSAGNRKTWTWAGWVKRGSLSGEQQLFLAAPSASDTTHIRFDGDYTFNVFEYAGSYTWRLQTSQLFRDCSAWYHVLVATDTTQASPSDRVKIYINGSQVTAFSTANYPSLNTDTEINNTVLHGIGRNTAINGNNFDGYLADVYLIDGSALDPTSFGEFDDNGVWQPIDASGLTYGTNGFHLDFADNSSAAALGYDAAGSNDWTVNNIAVTEPTGRYVPDVTGTPYSVNYGFAKMFNGDTASAYLGTNATTTTWTPSTPISFTSLRVHALQSSGSVTMTFNWAGGSYGLSLSTANASPKQWIDVSSNVTSPVTSITWSTASTNGPYVYAWEVDGVILTDAIFGSNNDSLRDSPTNGDTADDTGLGGELPGNYCTWNPLSLRPSTGRTLSNGNLDTNGDDSNFNGVLGTFGMPSGKWYWECTVGTVGFYNQTIVGIAKVLGTSSYIDYGYYSDTGQKREGSTGSAYGATFTSNDVIGIAFDADNGTLTFYKNGVSQGVAFTSIPSANYQPCLNGAGLVTYSANFGQRAFAYTAPSGFKALCTANLPTPTIAEGSTVMDVAPYIGNGTTLTISGLEFSPDLVWIKGRDFNSHHRLYDQIRLATNSLRSSSTDAEGVESTGLTAFTSDGFTLGSDPGHNNAGQAMVAWTWDAGSSTATNNSGSISSQVRANASAGFSIVTWSALSSAGSVGHGLNAVPSLLITKDRANYGWYVYHQSVGSGQYLLLNSTAAAASNSTVYSTSPTSTVFDPGTGFVTGGNWGNLVTYCFAPVAGYSAFGSFIGNGSSDGPFVYTGFRPRFLLYKCSSVGGDWWNFVDTARATYNVVGPYLESGTQAESTGSVIDVLSNGFKLRFGLGNQWNGAGQTYIYAAFAEHPFQTARAR